ncbi:vacuolar protein sorting-associated protein 13C [Thecamonas trahens ATCC 50062]|uniref:Vacuolar protein sorting-associated protein 13C n=1 Tax=Thecamonas trahens ATCC 50062 TaxID=461836 RepID=A0A0L0D9R2_THETB|nr:vacuolar protein sorting-associated protein 13C [Thecamonas trahens ATCC 50062]KNC49059.1 vacuolar protein sorting-associated protein 13C [Thecamonas trahens ATCC 50062]|eukprot:XP_013758092.1 vacuolar protein sorting-associated protein 13C [Thecamonas trahens ATCC 50062]
MFEGMVAGLLTKYLGDFVDNIDPKQLSISIWGGDVVLHDLNLKPDALASLELPVTVIRGVIGSLVLKADWKNLKSKPVVAELSDVYVVAGPKAAEPYDEKTENAKAQAAKQAQLVALEDAKAQAAAARAGQTPEEPADTFTSRLTAKVVDNIQVSIRNIHIRYEDDVTNPDAPFACGITLENLSAYSTDENWERKFLEGDHPLVHKVVDLRNLGVYWNPTPPGVQPRFVGAVPPARFAHSMGALVPRVGAPVGHHYLVRPISGTTHLILNKRTRPDMAVPKIQVTIELDALQVEMEEDQFGSAMALSQGFSLYSRGYKYRKHKPASRPTNGAEWWALARECVLADVRANSLSWSPAFFNQRISDKRMYVKLYSKHKLEPTKMTKQEEKTLAILESRLLFDDIRYFRSIADAQIKDELDARAEAKKASSGGWFSGWFGGGGSVEKKKDKAKDKAKAKGKGKSKGEPAAASSDASGSALALSDEQRAFLYSAIDYEDGEMHETEVPPGYVHTKATFSLGTFSISLKQDESAPLTTTALNGLVVDYKQRPANMEALYPDTRYPLIVSTPPPPPGVDRSVVPLIDLFYEQTPLDKHADMVVKLSARPLDVVYNAGFVTRISTMFTAAAGADSAEALDDLSKAYQYQVDSLRLSAANNIAYAVENHTTTDLQLDVAAPHILVPCSMTDETTKMLVVDLGKLSAHSQLVPPGESKSAAELNALSSDDPALYDIINVALHDVRVLVTDTSRVPLDVLMSRVPTSTGDDGDDLLRHEFLVRSFELSAQVANCVLPSNPKFTKVKVEGSLPSLAVEASTHKVRDLMAILDAVAAAAGPPVPALAADPLALGDEGLDGAPTAAQAAADAAYAAEVVDHAAELERAHEEAAAAAAQAEEIRDIDILVQRQLMFIDFVIHSIDVTLLDDFDPATQGRTDEPRPILAARLGGVAALYTQRPFDMQVNLGVSSLAVDDLVGAPGSPPLIGSSTTGAASELTILNVVYVAVQKDCPVFITTFDSTETAIDVNMNQLRIRVNPDTIHEALLWNTYAFPPAVEAESGELRARSLSVSGTAAEVRDDLSSVSGASTLVSRAATMLSYVGWGGPAATAEELAKQKAAARREHDRLMRAQAKYIEEAGLATSVPSGPGVLGASPTTFAIGSPQMHGDDVFFNTDADVATAPAFDPVVMRVRARLDGVVITLARRDNAGDLATVGLGASNVTYHQRPVTMEAVGALGALSLRDCSSQGTKYTDVLSIDGDKVLTFAYNTFDEDAADYPGYQTKVYARMASVRLVYLNRFITDLLTYNTVTVGRMLDVEEAATAAAATAREQAASITVVPAAAAAPAIAVQPPRARAESSAKAGPSGAAHNEATGTPVISKMKLDVVLISPTIIMPRASYCDDVLVLDLGEVAIENDFEDYDAESDVVMDVMSISITQMRLLMGEASAPDNWRNLLADASLSLTVKQSLCPWVKSVPPMIIAGYSPKMKLVLEQRDYVLLTVVASENMAEIPADAADDVALAAKMAAEIAAKNEAAEAARKAAREKAKKRDALVAARRAEHSANTLGVPGSPPPAANTPAPAADSETPTFLTMLVDAIVIDELELELFKGHASIASLMLSNVDVKYWTDSDEVMVADVSVFAITVRDTRAGGDDVSVHRDILAYVADIESPQLTVNYTAQPNGDSHIVLGLAKPRGVIVFDAVFALQDYFAPPLDIIDPAKSFADANEYEYEYEYAYDGGDEYAASPGDDEASHDGSDEFFDTSAEPVVTRSRTRARVRKPSRAEAGKSAAGDASNDATTPAPLASTKPAYDPVMTMAISIVEPEFCLVESPTAVDTKALVLGFSLDMDYLGVAGPKPRMAIDARLRGLDIIKCKLSARETTELVLMEPCNLTAKYDVESRLEELTRLQRLALVAPAPTPAPGTDPENGGAGASAPAKASASGAVGSAAQLGQALPTYVTETEIEAKLDAIDLRIAYRDYLLINAIMATLSPAPVENGSADDAKADCGDTTTLSDAINANQIETVDADAVMADVEDDAMDLDLDNFLIGSEASGSDDGRACKAEFGVKPAAELTPAARDAGAVAEVFVEKLNAEVVALRAVVINDRLAGQETPLVDFRIRTVQAAVTNWSSNMDARVALALTSDYYNNKLALWEPMVEQWGLIAHVTSTVEPEAMHIHVEAPAVLNVTVTHTFVEAMYKVSYMLAEEDAASSESVAADVPFEPYRIVNATGASVKYWLAADEVRRLPIFGAEPFDFKAAVASGALSSGNDAGESGRSYGIDRPHYIVVRVAGFGDVTQIPVDRVGEYRYTLVPRTSSRAGKVEAERPPIMLEVRVALEGDTKVVTLLSMVRVVNKTVMPMSIRLDCPDMKPVVLPPLAPEGETCLPIHLAHSARVKVRPAAGAIVPGSKSAHHWPEMSFAWTDYEEHVSRKDNGERPWYGYMGGETRASALEETAANGMGSVLDPDWSVVVMITRNSAVEEGMMSSVPASLPHHTLTLSPPLVLQGVVPGAMEFQLEDAESEHALEGELAEGEEVHVYGLHLGHPILLRVRIPSLGYHEWSESAVVFAKPATKSLGFTRTPKTDPFVVLHDGAGRELKLELLRRKTAGGGGRHVGVFAPYWILNQSHLPLTVTQEHGFNNKHTEVAGLPGGGLPHGELLMTAFPEAGLLKRKLAIRVGGESKFSKSFSIDAVGSVGVVQVKGMALPEVAEAEAEAETETKDTAEGKAETEAEASGDDACVERATALFEFGVSVTTGTGPFAVVKQVTVAPRFVIVNRVADFGVRVQQVGAPEGTGVPVAAGGRTPFHWVSSKLKRHVSLVVEGAGWLPSGPFSIDDLGVFGLKCYNEETDMVYIFSVEVKLVGASVYVVVSPDTGTAPFMLENMSSLPIFCWQDGHPELGLELGPLCRMPYAWDAPASKRRLWVAFGDMASEEAVDARIAVAESTSKATRVKAKIKARLKAQRGVKSYNLSRFKHYKPYKIGSGLPRAVVDIFPDGPTRVFRVMDKGSKLAALSAAVRAPDFDDETEYEESVASSSVVGSGDVAALRPEEQEEVMSFGVTADIAGVAVSVVDAQPTEILYFGLESIAANYSVSNMYERLEVLVANVQLDNALGLAQYPVVLGPRLDKLGEKPVVTLGYTKSVKYPDIQYYHQASFLLQEMNLMVEEAWLSRVLAFVSTLPEAPTPPTGEGDGDSGPGPMSVSQAFIAAAAEEVGVEQSGAALFYFQTLLLNPIKINVTYSSSALGDDEGSSSDGAGNGNDDEVGGSMSVLHALGFTFANVDAAPLKFNLLMLEHVFESQNEVVSRITTHYVMQGVAESYKLIGSVEVLGNPVGLFNNLGTGVADFFVEPAKGITQSPREFGKGLGRGTSSLLKNSVYGVFNSAAAVTGTVGRGLGYLTLDDEYIERRARAERNKPKHVGDGLKQGFTAFGRGIFEGVTGIAYQPYKGAKKAGFKGFVKGMGKGVTGLLFKPVAGALDLVTKTAEGIRNTATYFDAKAARLRPPRYIGPDGRLLAYSPVAAYGQDLLDTAKGGDLVKTDHYVFHAELYNRKGHYVVVSDKHLLMVQPKKRETSTDWVWPLAGLVSVELEGDTVTVTGSTLDLANKVADKVLKTKPKQLHLQMIDDKTAVWLANRIELARDAWLVARSGAVMA